jgi:hypothetical protein
VKNNLYLPYNVFLTNFRSLISTKICPYIIIKTSCVFNFLEGTFDGGPYTHVFGIWTHYIASCIFTFIIRDHLMHGLLCLTNYCLCIFLTPPHSFCSIDDGFPVITFSFEGDLTLNVYPDDYLFQNGVG